ncbi:MAG: S41 family peptidase [bacterium]|nr:S41 family peptidase [bacterium]
MQNTEGSEVAVTRPVKKKSSLKKWLGLIVAAILIFNFGWFLGSGRIQVKNYNSVSSNNNLPAKLDLSSVDTIYQSLRQNYDGELNEEQLLEGIKSGLAKAAGDPYTEYFNPETAAEFENGIDGIFEGIGAQLGKDADGNIIVISPIAGYPAEKAGLKAKDIIAQIDNESAFDLTISEAVDKIRGKKGTSVKLSIVRGDEVLEKNIVRETIDIPSVESEIKDGIGIMTISRFGDDTVALARAAAQDFKSKNVKGVVLDLRGNPGGYLEGAVDVSSLWLSRGKTVLTERRDNVVIDTLEASGNAPLEGIKTVVLIDEGSASASEIVAGALRDNNAATIVGQKSFGKGSVQQPIDLGDGGLLKVTIARWYTPAGKNIDKEGITPGQVVARSSEDITAERDPQLDAALAKLK